MPSTPKEEIYNRIRKLQELLRAEDLDGALVVQRADLYYLSGTAQDAHLFVPAVGDPSLLVRKSIERAVEDSPMESVDPVTKLSQVGERVRASLGAGSLRLGMELDVLPVNLFRMYEEIFSSCEIRDVSPSIRRLRMKKSRYELGLIRRAAEDMDVMFREVGNLLEEGITEFEFSARVEAVHRRRGHQGFVRARGFNSEVFFGHIMSGSNLAVPSCSVGPTGGSGPSAAFPQGAGFKRIGRHEPVQIDHCGVCGGYMVDQARTFYVGDPPDEFVRIHEKALEIQEAVVKKAVVGACAEDLYETAVSMAREAGLEEGFMGYPRPVGFVGHGVGLELDELPVIGKRSGTLLEEGMVFALEPKFILPGKGLAGIENSYVVTADGLERLTPFDDAIQVVPA
jgi:Xaa-Pro aminopeptidase